MGDESDDAVARAVDVDLEQLDVESPHSSVADMVEEVLPTVVNVRVTAFEFDPLGEPEEQRGQGSGVVIDEAGIILTNNHVVAGSTEVNVVFNDDHGTLEGTVIGTAPEKDLAVIQVDADDLDAIDIGRSSTLRLGDEVVAIGFPLGLGVNVTKGIISALDRNVRVSGLIEQDQLEGLLQTDAAINPGNSGGALVDLAGNLVGINTAAASAGSAENIGFAIAMDGACRSSRRSSASRPTSAHGSAFRSRRSRTKPKRVSWDSTPRSRGALITGIIRTARPRTAGWSRAT